MREATVKPRRRRAQNIGLFLGPVVLLLLMQLDLTPGNPAPSRLAAVAGLMAVWWITEAIPLFATAMLPVVLYPLLGILSGKATAPIYFNSTIFLFLGGFMIALTMEKWRLHRRIALKIIRFIGGGPSRIVLGFMIAAAFLSMWISNTATAVMMVPIGLAIILQMEEKFGREVMRKFSVALMLGIAYACSTGGIATLVGTPPNLSFARIFEIMFPDGPPMEFGRWILLGIPVTLTMLLLTWVFLTKLFFRAPEHVYVDRKIVDEEYSKLGRTSFEERAVLVVFALTALLWVFRKPLEFGAFTIPGWSEILPHPDLIDDGTVAIAMALTLFLIPSHSKDAPTPMVADIQIIPRLPWGIVLLFGGGFALAKGFQVTGLSVIIGNQFGSLADLSPFVMTLFTCLTLTFLTELTSNTATTEMILPILASVAVAMKTNPLLLMIPATISASCAFMMPVATPPNAIVFGSGRVRVSEMARVGVVLNLVGVLVIATVFYVVGLSVFGIDLSAIPEWATTTAGGQP
jgi:sodium-dependent dicarboxylate transporter 2/3/5